MLTNFTNHPISNWSVAQFAAAHSYIEIYDIPFPHTDPYCDKDMSGRLQKSMPRKFNHTNLTPFFVKVK